MKPFLKCIVIFLLVTCLFAEDDSPELLYRDAFQRWQQAKGRDWSPWLDFSQKVMTSFDKADARSRVELVGAFEEGILAIERATVAMGDGADPERDSALSRLYFGYGRLLSLLKPDECLALAHDPHTLLIGAEKATQEYASTLCIENAENALRNSVTLDATHNEAEDLLKNITGTETVHKRKPKEFVSELFDSFADTFDDKLNSLGYAVPKMMGETAQQLLSESKKSFYQGALDAGCGTGLAGRFLRPLVSGPMVGVDASKKMLDIASQCTINRGCGIDDKDIKDNNDDDRPLYESLLSLDLEEMTLDNTLNSPSLTQKNNDLTGFDLVIAADVLVYFGQLDHLLEVFSSVSNPGAALVFTCERTSEEEAPLGWRLLSSGRFAHTKEHAVAAAARAGYELVTYKEIVPRMERGEDVQGHLFGFFLSNRENEMDGNSMKQCVK